MLSSHFGENKTKCIQCYLDANFSGESVAMKSLQKIDKKLQFLYKQNEFSIQNYVDFCVTL